MVGKTYASLILGLLTDLALQGKNKEKVYIVELGAGHGRLGFYILQELEIMTEQSAIELPPYCYVLSDIVQKNLDFFDDHENFQGYFQKGQLDLAYLDAMGDEDIVLVKSGVVLSKGILHQPVVVIANYFFDSIPQHLFYLSQGTVASCQVALDADVPVEAMPKPCRKRVYYCLWPVCAASPGCDSSLRPEPWCSPWIRAITWLPYWITAPCPIM